MKDAAERRLNGIFDRIADQLGSGPWLLGQTFSAADLYLFMLIRWGRAMPRPPADARAARPARRAGAGAARRAGGARGRGVAAALRLSGGELPQAEAAAADGAGGQAAAAEAARVGVAAHIGSGPDSRQC